MKKWQCPKCKNVVEAIASSVSHRCPSNKNLSTGYTLIEEDEE